MTRPKSLEAIPDAIQVPIRGFADLLKSLCGEHALALTLIGSAASGESVRPTASIRSVLVLDAVDLDALRRISEQGLRFGKQNIAAPLIMTPPYIKASCDTFPLELLDICLNRCVVFGNDYFEDLSFENSDIRHQCERELKVLAISLRQGLLAAAGRQTIISEVVQDAQEGLLRVMRGMLWLKNQRDGLVGSRVVEEIEKLTDCKLHGVRAIKSEDNTTPSPKEFDQLYRDVEALGAIADAW
jgi:hypothetical protein